MGHDASAAPSAQTENRTATAKPFLTCAVIASGDTIRATAFRVCGCRDGFRHIVGVERQSQLFEPPGMPAFRIVQRHVDHRVPAGGQKDRERIGYRHAPLTIPRGAMQIIRRPVQRPRRADRRVLGGGAGPPAFPDLIAPRRADFHRATQRNAVSRALPVAGAADQGVELQRIDCRIGQQSFRSASLPFSANSPSRGRLIDTPSLSGVVDALRVGEKLGQALQGESFFGEGRCSDQTRCFASK